MKTGLIGLLSRQNTLLRILTTACKILDSYKISFVWFTCLFAHSRTDRQTAKVKTGENSYREEIESLAFCFIKNMSAKERLPSARM